MHLLKVFFTFFVLVTNTVIAGTVAEPLVLLKYTNVNSTDDDATAIDIVANMTNIEASLLEVNAALGNMTIRDSLSLEDLVYNLLSPLASENYDIDTLAAELLSSDESLVHLSGHKRANACNGISWVEYVKNIGSTQINSLKTMWAEFGWRKVAQCLEYLASLAANSLSATDSIAGYLGQEKDRCASVTLNIAGHFVTINNYTSGGNCDTQAGFNSIAESVERSIADTKSRNLADAKSRILVAWCLTMTNQGTWTAKVKFLNHMVVGFMGLSDINCPSKAEVIHDEF